MRRFLAAFLLCLAGCADAPPDDAAPQRCDRDDQCLGGQSCRDGRCVAAPCDEAADCEPGYTCQGGTCQRERDDCRDDAECVGDRCPGGACRCVEGRCASIECRDGESRPCRVDCLEGVERCNQGAWRQCSAQIADHETCGDGLDNDCDGRVDDADPLCGACTDGQERPCRTACGTGVERCVGESWQGCTAPRAHDVDICGNDVDDDCNGEVDDGCDGCRDGDARPCATRCGEGEERCDGGRWRDCTAAEPADETCNGRDDDCDGATDEEIVRDCTNACGAGVETCKQGEWQGCTAPDGCPCTGDASDDQVCGACGVRSRTCAREAWGPWGACREREDVCRPGDEERGGCGRCGTQRRLCNADCGWGDWQACRDEGTCEPGTTETEDCPGGCGTRTRTCTDACGWGEWSGCGAGGLESCVPGDEEARPCGDRCGVQRRRCEDACAWGPWGECGGEGECRPGDEGAEACAGACAARVRVCGEDCAWGDFGACSSEGQCTPGDRETRDCGLCGEQSRTCDDGCLWSDWSECGGAGVCAPGDREERRCGTTDRGICEYGVQVRTCDGACAWTPFDGCRGNVEPQREICGDGVDQDCDGGDQRQPDRYEPNNECGRCTVVRDDDEPDVNVWVEGTIDSVEDRADFYCFDAHDGISIPGFTERIVVTLERVPNGADFDVYLYQNDAGCRAGTPLALSRAGGSADERIEWGERLRDDDGGRYVVEVRRFQGNVCGAAYRLTINGLN